MNPISGCALVGRWPAFLLSALISGFAADGLRGEIPTPSNWAALVEADWLVDEQLRAERDPTTLITPQKDAAGGCDGIKNGTWGFHTGHAAVPWWQVDLGTEKSINRVVVWNRCDAPSASERATNLVIRFSLDGQSWRTVYRHTGSVFFGFSDKKPLVVELTNGTARHVRLENPGGGFLHLDEVEIFGPAESQVNLALRKPADQVSTSTWSADHSPRTEPNWRRRTAEVLATCKRLEQELADAPNQRRLPQRLDLESVASTLSRLEQQLRNLSPDAPADPLFREARGLQRRLTLRSPLLDFDTILFTKRVPSSFNHMSDQYYGWWSQPGGGIFLLRHFQTDSPSVECLTEAFTQRGSFLRPTLSYDARKVLFAWCRFYPQLANESNKLDKANVPEDAFFHLFEMNLDRTGLRQLTHGKYDDFDGRYLPDGRIVFLSTRRGQGVQVGRASAQATLARGDLPDCYVRCGGGPERPVAVYTLHTINADGTGLCAISPFEMFEWTPEVGHDGSILYSRWDYIDRDNMPYMGLWAMNPDGTNPRIVYGNFAKAPHCAFEPKPIPQSRKIVFTASAHHAHTMGSLVLLDPSVGTEGAAPITRLTPEVPFPEIEGWPKTSYASPWPLSERGYLVAWGHEGLTVPGPEGWNRWHAVQRPKNGMSLYFFDATLGKELLYQDLQIACVDPIPVRPRTRPPTVASQVAWDEAPEGQFLLTDVYRGFKKVPRGTVSTLRIVAVPPKTHPTMNYPNMGITADDPGKCVLGTVPVENDGSAFFRAPAGVTLFFQALDRDGMAVQTMRSATHVQPGQILSCIGCHEDRNEAPPQRPPLAARRQPSKITVGPEGSWPIEFSKLVQPVLDRQCLSCHQPNSGDAKAAKYDLSPARAYESLVRFGKPSLQEQVWAGYRRGASIDGEGLARDSKLMELLSAPQRHYDVSLTPEDRERLVTWIDTYAQRAGAFSPGQTAELERLRRASAAFLIERPSRQTAAHPPSGPPR